MNETTKSELEDLGSQNHKKLRSFKIKESDIESSAPDVSPEKAWVLSLVNQTDYCYEYVQVTNANGAWGKWYPMTPACRTCNLASFPDCIKQGRYVSILVTECASHAFSISIATKPDANGNSIGSTWENIQPKCQFPGGVIGIY